MAKSGLIQLICKVLGKSMPYVVSKDSRAFETFKNLPENLTISLGVLKDETYLTLQKTDNQILIIKNDHKKQCDLEIKFKNRKSAKLVLLGSISVAESFARHDILLRGNINTAVALVRIIDLCEYYLFPRLITYKFLPKMRKEFCSLSLYAFCVFGRASKIKITNPIERRKEKKKENKLDKKEKQTKSKNSVANSANTEKENVELENKVLGGDENE